MGAGVVIVGAGQGGGQLVLSLRQEGFTGPIALVGDEADIPYQRPPLSKAYLKDGRDERLHLRKMQVYEEQGIDLRIPARVTDIGRENRQAVLSDGEILDWDHLVIATGTRVARPPIPGLDLPGVFAIRTLDDARQLRAAMPSVRRAVVIGGGFIGLEFAAVAAAAGCQVTVVEGGDRVMARAVSAHCSDLFQASHRAAGVELLLRTFVRRIIAGPDGRASLVETSDGQQLPADMVILAAGVVPNVELAEAAGLSVENGISVNALLTTDDPQIYALGDCASFPDPVTGQRIRLESVQAATDHARTIARAIMGRAEPYAALPWFWSDQGDMKLQIAGLGRGDEAGHHWESGPGSHVIVREVGGLVTAVETINAPAQHMAARKLLATGPADFRRVESFGLDIKACMAATVATDARVA